MSNSSAHLLRKPAPNPLLSVHELTVAFSGVKVVDGVSFTIHEGETLALVGESGSGKSMTALSLLQLLPGNADILGGHIRFRGDDLLAMAEPQRRHLRGNRLAMVFQEPMTSLNPLHRVHKQLDEALAIHQSLSAPQRHQRVMALLSEVGLAQKAQALPHELSGGERQRVMIAMALANEPDLMIADEPTTALDVLIQQDILWLLKGLQQKYGMAILFISHDLLLVKRLAERVCVMQHGAIVEQGLTHQVFQQPQHIYTQELLAAQPRGLATAPTLDAPVLLTARAVRVRFPRPQRGWGFGRESLTAVDGVSMTVHAGQTLAIVGASGSGKSTLGLALLGLVPYEGQVIFDGQDLHTLSARALRRRRRQFQIVFQDPYGSLNPRMTVGDLVGEGLLVHERLNRADRLRRVRKVLEEVGLDPSTVHRYPHEFSGGQRQRLAIARALILEPRLVVLDEPTSALDVSVQAQLMALLQDLQRRRGLAYVFISHDLRVVRALAHQVVVMEAGHVVEQASCEQLFAAPQADYTRRLLAAAFLTGDAVPTADDFVPTTVAEGASATAPALLPVADDAAPALPVADDAAPALPVAPTVTDDEAQSP